MALLEREVLEAAVCILAAADESFADVPTAGFAPRDRFELLVLEGLLVNEGATLCRDVPSSCGLVLPKLHTPQSGITLRSLSHHLAWIRASEVTARWQRNEPLPNSSTNSNALSAQSEGLNLLLLPWPEELVPTQFSRARAGQRGMPKSFGHFCVRTMHDSEVLVRRATEACKRAREKNGRVDAIVLPECSTRCGDAARISQATETIVIAGVGEGEKRKAVNRVEFALPYGGGIAVYSQGKHHRWKLDRSQIVQYGLASQLALNRTWWESFEIETRELFFTAISEATTLAVMICEDLARPDPAAEIIRAVGPSLVIALLLDGPQLLTRWPARYATVLEQDPGSSVLTLTSLGMALLSRRPDQPPSRVVGLWKDSRSGPAKELWIPDGACGLLLSLSYEWVKEYTADGRHDQYRGANKSRGATPYLVYSGCQAVQQ